MDSRPQNRYQLKIPRDWVKRNSGWKFHFSFYELLNIVNSDMISRLLWVFEIMATKLTPEMFSLGSSPLMHALLDNKIFIKSLAPLYFDRHATSFVVSRANSDLLHIWLVMSQMSQSGDMMSQKRAIFGHKMRCSKMRQLMGRTDVGNPLHTAKMKKLALDLSNSSQGHSNVYNIDNLNL